MRFNHENGLSCLVLECGLPRLNLMRCVGSRANYVDLIRFEMGGGLSGPPTLGHFLAASRPGTGL
jgi:hypothetical protein